MTTTTADPIVRAYLDELRAAARHLPRARRAELVQEIEEYLTEALPPGATEAEVRTVLDRLGDPEQIVAEERGRTDVRNVRAGWVEWVAVVLLPVGGVVIPVLGWVVGAALLWASRIWTLRDKLVGTLLVPGGLLGAVALFIAAWPVMTCTSKVVRVHTKTGATMTLSPGGCVGEAATPDRILIWLLLAALLLVPVATSIYLARRAQQQASEPI
jgi:uncharacterized membrane protein